MTRKKLKLMRKITLPDRFKEERNAKRMTFMSLIRLMSEYTKLC